MIADPPVVDDNPDSSAFYAQIGLESEDGTLVCQELLDRYDTECN